MLAASTLGPAIRQLHKYLEKPYPQSQRGQTYRLRCTMEAAKQILCMSRTGSVKGWRDIPLTPEEASVCTVLAQTEDPKCRSRLISWLSAQELHRPTTCPVCQADADALDWVNYPQEAGQGQITVEVLCLRCQTTWQEAYQFVEVRNVLRGKEHDGPRAVS